MAWRWSGDKPLPGPTSDNYLYHFTNSDLLYIWCPRVDAIGLITRSPFHSKGNHSPHGLYTQSSDILNFGVKLTSTGIDADASKGETSPGYFNSKLVHSYKCGTICPWEFPEISLAYSHILLKGTSKPSRPIIYGKIFWPPHIASPASICHRNQLSFVFRLSFHLTIHFENAGNICNKYDL